VVDAKNVVIFFGVIAVLAIFLSFLSSGFVGIDFFLVALALVIIFVVLSYSNSAQVMLKVPEYERAVIFRMGKYNATKGPGWIILVPFIDTFKIVNMRVQTVDVRPQEILTKGNIKMTIDTVIYLRVIDPKKSIIEVTNYHDAIITFTKATVRDVVGNLEFRDIVENIESINREVLRQISKVSDEWGILVESVEIQDVKLPKEVIDAMHNFRAAEQNKFAAQQNAEAKKIEIEAIQDAASNLSESTISYMYLEALKKMANGRSNKLIFPVELTKLAQVVSSKIGGKVDSEEIKQGFKENYGGVLKKYLDDVEKKGVRVKITDHGKPIEKKELIVSSKKKKKQSASDVD